MRNSANETYNLPAHPVLISPSPLSPFRLVALLLYMTRAQQLLIMKHDALDFHLNDASDHRKRRRNRTTQSCLNCHTSKRKCDRKRPCSRCIQLGLTGLCVYEVDDPSRDDPLLDEKVRLRNRIAELESLVRELRGKPHPRWAGTRELPSDRWHSRSSRAKRRSFSPQLDEVASDRSSLSCLIPIKTEGHSDKSLLSSSSSDGLNSDGLNYAYDHRSPTLSYPEYSEPPGRAYTSPASVARMAYERQARYDIPPESYCHCHTSAGPIYGALGHQLQTAVATLHHIHAQDSPCIIYHRIIQLDEDLRNSGPSSHASTSSSPTYTKRMSNTPPDSELLTPASSTSLASHAFHHGESSAVSSPHEQWTQLGMSGATTTTTYTPAYFSTTDAYYTNGLS